MELLLFHPGPASIACDECRKYVYDIKTGKRQTYHAGPSREELPCVRPSSTPPPCDQCPKGPPGNAEVLSRRNQRAVRMYLELRAAGWSTVTASMRRDRRWARNMATVDRTWREWERAKTAGEIAEGVALGLLRTLRR